jgi:hypothetical protein
MRNLLMIGFTFFLLACGQNPANLTGESPVAITDFYKAFNSVSLPINIADSNVNEIKEGKEIGRKLLGQYINASTLETILPNNDKKTTLFPLFKIEKEGEHYLILKIKKQFKIEIGILVFSKENKFLAFKSIIEFKKEVRQVANNSKSLLINNEPSFLIFEKKINKDRNAFIEKTAWAFTAGSFQIIFVDSEQKKGGNSIINPIDTLSTNNTFSGNYALNEKNFISLRDNGTPNKYQFFLHTESNKGACIGELKGLLNFNKNIATYSEKGDACQIDFVIKGNNISIKENGNCGNHRGLDCSFDESFSRKKKPKKKK